MIMRSLFFCVLFFPPELRHRLSPVDDVPKIVQNIASECEDNNFARIPQGDVCFKVFCFSRCDRTNVALRWFRRPGYNPDKDVVFKNFASSNYKESKTFLILV